MRKIFKRDKWKPEDITVSIEQGELKFSATICYSKILDYHNDNSRREYTIKNLKVVNQIFGLIHRCNISCWEVEEHFSDREGEEKVSVCFTLHYYPLREPTRDSYIDMVTNEEVVIDETLFHEDIGFILELFNRIVW